MPLATLKMKTNPRNFREYYLTDKFNTIIQSFRQHRAIKCTFLLSVSSQCFRATHQHLNTNHSIQSCYYLSLCASLVHHLKRKLCPLLVKVQSRNTAARVGKPLAWPQTWVRAGNLKRLPHFTFIVNFMRLVPLVKTRACTKRSPQVLQ